MIAVLAWVGGILGGWVVVACLLAVAIGRCTKIADRREAQR